AGELNLDFAISDRNRLMIVAAGVDPEAGGVGTQDRERKAHESDGRSGNATVPGRWRPGDGTAGSVADAPARRRGAVAELEPGKHGAPRRVDFCGCGRASGAARNIAPGRVVQTASRAVAGPNDGTHPPQPP